MCGKISELSQALKGLEEFLPLATFNLLKNIIRGLEETYKSRCRNRKSYLALDLRNLRDLLLKSLAPDKEIKKTKWYRAKKRKISWLDRLYYAVCEKISPEVSLTEEAKRDLKEKLKLLNDALSQINNYVHILPPYYNEKNKRFEEIFETCLSGFVTFVAFVKKLKIDTEKYICRLQKSSLCSQERVFASVGWFLLY